jgi:hypothetical protein
MEIRIFLGLSALLWFPYGLYCFFDPAFLAGAAGVASTTPTGTIELRAMYGGLQVGIGALAALGAVRPTFARPALVALAFLCSGLFLARIVGAGWGGEFSSYTVSALGIEITSAALALLFLGRVSKPAAA